MRKFLTSVLLMLCMTLSAQDNTIRDGGEYYLYNMHYGRCLGGNAANDGPALSAAKDDMSGFVWVAEASSLDSGWYWLRHKATGKYLQASNASGNTWSCWFAGSLNKSYNSYEWQLEPGTDGYVKSFRGNSVNGSNKCYLGIDTGKESADYINVYYDKALGEISAWQIVDAAYPLNDGRLKLYTDKLDDAIATGEATYNNDLYGKPDELAVALYNARSARETASLDNVELMTTATTALNAAVSNAMEGKYKIWISGSSFGVGKAFALSLINVSFKDDDAAKTGATMIIRNTEKTGAMVTVTPEKIIVNSSLTIDNPNDDGTYGSVVFSFDGDNLTVYVDGDKMLSTPQVNVGAYTSVGTSAEWTVIGSDCFNGYCACIVSQNTDYENMTTNSHGKYEMSVVSMKNVEFDLAPSDLHILASSDAMEGSTINLYDPDSWIIFDNIRPSDVVGSYLSHIKVEGENAVSDANARVAIYLQGAVVYPFTTSDVAMYGYSGELYSGKEYTFKLGANNDMGEAANELQSFILKRGYMVCFSTNSDGSGYSRVYVADHEDKRIDVLPDLLKHRISRAYIRKWNWVSKKGWCSTEGTSAIATEGKQLGCTWFYTWGSDRTSQTDMEYVPHKNHIYWPDWGTFYQANSTCVLGYNEPDHSEQHSDDCGTTIDSWKACTHQPEFMACGLRVGSPAPTDASWLTSFIGHCDDMAYRCDFVAFHAYWGTNEAANSDSWWSQLNSIYKNTGRPIWLTEWNNGASWTTESWPSSYSDKLAQQKNAIKYILSVLDNADFIERYSLYNWDTYYRAAISWDSDKNSWWVTPCGEVYRDTHPTHAYQEKMQKVPVGWWPSTKTDNSFSYKITAAGLKFNMSITNNNGDYTDTEVVEYKDRATGEWKTFYDNSNGRSKFDSTAERTTTLKLDSCTAEALTTDSLTLRLHITTLGGGDTKTAESTVVIPAFVRSHYMTAVGITPAAIEVCDEESEYFTSDGRKVVYPVKGKAYIVKKTDGSVTKQVYK